jgi:bifunctional DNA-binding transcriptional regulator/antitoxin component of YhaV-PrlF toxin-antitoxin module
MNKKSNAQPAQAEKIILPQEIRQAMGWDDKLQVEVWLNGTDGEVVIKPHHSTCVFCGATGNWKAYRKKRVCPSCRKELAEQ